MNCDDIRVKPVTARTAPDTPRWRMLIVSLSSINATVSTGNDSAPIQISTAISAAEASLAVAQIRNFLRVDLPILSEGRWRQPRISVRIEQATFSDVTLSSELGYRPNVSPAQLQAFTGGCDYDAVIFLYSNQSSVVSGSNVTVSGNDTLSESGNHTTANNDTSEIETQTRMCQCTPISTIAPLVQYVTLQEVLENGDLRSGE